MRRTTILASLALTSAIACVESKTPPNIPFQATIGYGPKVFLVDDTVGAAPRDEMCTRLGMVMTTTTSTVVEVPPTDGVLDAEGQPKPILSSIAHNCYVNVKPKSLKMDSLEVTNDLFQVCVDSGVCQRPDPSAASKGQVCSSEDGFDRCPVVEVTHTQADRFCKFIGRRLPSGLEHIITRQATAANTQDPTSIPVYPTGSREEMNSPATCQSAIVGTAGCGRPVPVTPGSKPEDVKGAAAGDVVNGDMGQVFDLIGNVSEWSSDLIPAIRGLGTGLPWFCVGPVPPVAVGQEPQCPTGQTCVYGQIQPPGLGLKSDYPICVTSPQLRQLSGAHGALFGGNFADNKADRQHFGVFGRRSEMSPDDQPAKSYGFRCSGDVGVDDEPEAM